MVTKERCVEQIELKTGKRKLLGKKSRYLRRQGITPVHLYGHGIDSLALQCETAQLEQVLKEAGATHLVSLNVDRASKPRNVVIREVQRHPISGELVHVDFYEVRMEEKIKVEVPISFVGEAPALKTKGSMIIHELSRMEIECLPDRIPNTVPVNLGVLEHEDQSIQVRDISLGEGISILQDPDQVIVRVAPLPTEKVEAAAKPEEEEEAVTAEADSGAERKESKEEGEE